MTGTWQAPLARPMTALSLVFLAAEKSSRSFARGALKRLPQPLYLEAGAKQREQASEQDYPAFGRQQNVDAGSEFGSMPEDDDAEQCAAEDETETAEEKK